MSTNSKCRCCLQARPPVVEWCPWALAVRVEMLPPEEQLMLGAPQVRAHWCCHLEPDLVLQRPLLLPVPPLVWLLTVELSPPPEPWGIPSADERRERGSAT